MVISISEEFGMEKYIIIVLGIVILWLILNFALLVVRNVSALNTFKKLELLLKKRYAMLEKILSKTDTTKYLKELESLPDGIKFLNRKLALNYIISQDLVQNYDETILPEEYRVLNAEINCLGNIYNNRATRLKISVEVFPTALMARLMNIKTVDFYRG